MNAKEYPYEITPTWRNELVRIMSEHGETLANIVAVHPLVEAIDIICTAVEQPDLTVWTKGRVYFTQYEGNGTYLASAPRNPCEDAVVVDGIAIEGAPIMPPVKCQYLGPQRWKAEHVTEMVDGKQHTIVRPVRCKPTPCGDRAVTLMQMNSWCNLPVCAKHRAIVEEEAKVKDAPQ